MSDLGVYTLGARTKRVYPLRKRRGVLGSAPSGRGQHQVADWGKGEIEGWGDLGVYAFGARTKRVYPLRKRREVLESDKNVDF
jgi:hypothetical protein